MPTYEKPTGSSGTMRITDNGLRVEFWLKAGSSTFNHELPWGYTVNGITSGTRYFDFQSGGAWQRLAGWDVTTTQTVVFRLFDSGTSGLGGPTTFSQAINRAKIPGPASIITLTNMDHDSVHCTFTDGAANGDAIDARQIGYGTSPTATQFIVSSDRSTDITGLSAGTTYYFWARCHNSVGWGPWGPRANKTTLDTPSGGTAPVLSAVTQKTVTVTWSPPPAGGAAILEYQVGYGTSSSAPTSTVSANSPRVITGLTPGTRYYFWIRARNSVGWGDWSASSNTKTIAGARVKVGAVWKEAVPYVRDSGVWKVAEPWGRYVGVWKKTI